MKRLLDAQTCGSLAVLGSFGASEMAAIWLNASPSSPLAWYLNLELFHSFEPARRPASPLHLLFGPNALAIDLVLLILIVVVRLVRFRFGVALFSNLAFVATIMLVYSCLQGQPQLATASLAAIDFNRNLDGLLAGLLATSFVAFALSHVTFALAILERPQSASMTSRPWMIG